jgi:cell division protein FtsW
VSDKRAATEAQKGSLRFDPLLLSAVVALAVFGVVMVYSASAVYAGQKLNDSLFFFKRQAAGVGLGLVLLLAVIKIGYRKLELLASPLLLLSIAALVMVLVPGLGHAAGGAQRWLRVGPLQFQPSELAKIALVLWLARSLSKRGESIKLFSAGMLPHLIALAVVGGLLLGEKDFGSTAVLVLLTFSLLFVAGARFTYLLALVPVALGAGAALIYSHSYRVDRLKTFLDPWKDPQGKGYQVIESLLGYGAGGAFGVGLGASKQKLFFLPAAHTDFILAIVGEELGFAGVCAVLLLFALLVWRGLRASFAAPEAFGCYAALGLTLLIGFEALVNAGMTLSLLPTKGMALPFLSYGMTSTVACCLAAGVLLSISGGPGGYLKAAAGGRR